MYKEHIAYKYQAPTDRALQIEVARYDVSLSEDGNEATNDENIEE